MLSVKYMGWKKFHIERKIYTVCTVNNKNLNQHYFITKRCFGFATTWLTAKRDVMCQLKSEATDNVR